MSRMKTNHPTDFGTIHKLVPKEQLGLVFGGRQGQQPQKRRTRNLSSKPPSKISLVTRAVTLVESVSLTITVKPLMVIQLLEAMSGVVPRQAISLVLRSLTELLNLRTPLSLVEYNIFSSVVEPWASLRVSSPRASSTHQPLFLLKKVRGLFLDYNKGSSSKVESAHDQISMSAASPSKLGRSPKPKNVAIEIHTRLIKPPHKIVTEIQPIVLEGTSLAFLSETNPFRLLIASMVISNKFETLILCLIAISSVIPQYYFGTGQPLE